MNPPYYPNLDGKVDYDVAQGIRTAYDFIHKLAARLDTIEKSGLLTRDQALTHLGPKAMSKHLTVNGSSPLNVAGLIGQLAQPQIGQAPNVGALPGIQDPLSQDGTLVSLADRVYRFDGTTDPGKWIPITSGPAPGTAVTSLDGLTGAITLVAGTNITISDNTPAAGDIKIDASGGGSLDVNGAPVGSPNINDTTPAAPGGSANVLWQVSGSDISGYYTPSSTGVPNSVRQFGAVGDGVTDDSAAFSAAAAAFPEGIIDDLPNCLIGTNLTLSCPIQFLGGYVDIATGVTLTLNGTVLAPADHIFRPTGTGVVVIGTGTPSVYAEWWGAVGDGVTDDYTAIQAAITSLYGPGAAGSNDGTGNVQLLGKTYKIGTGLTITHGGVSLLGLNEGWNGYTNAPFLTALTTTSATITMVSFAGVSSSWATDNNLKDIAITRSVQPTGTATGVSLTYLYRLTVDHVFVANSIRGFYIANVGRGGNGLIKNSNTGLSSVSGAGTYYGFYIDETGTNVTPSLFFFNNTSGIGTGSPTTTYGMYVTGYNIQDLQVDHYETAQLSYGVYLNMTGGSGNLFANADNHFTDNVHDRCTVSAFYISGMSNSFASSVEITGGWCNTEASTPSIDIENSNGVTISRVLLGSSNNNRTQIKISGGGGNSLLGNVFLPLKTSDTGILLNSTSNNTVADNLMDGSGATVGITLTSADRNVISGNSLYGTMTTGLSFDATSDNNQAYPNSIDPTSITTPISDSGTGNITSPLSSAVTSIDGITGAVTLVAGTGMTITDNSPSAGDITFASAAATDYVVASDGGTPPTPINDGAGNFIYVGYTP